jgi:hypothetical protein
MWAGGRSRAVQAKMWDSIWKNTTSKKDHRDGSNSKALANQDLSSSPSIDEREIQRERKRQRDREREKSPQCTQGLKVSGSICSYVVTAVMLASPAELFWGWVTFCVIWVQVQHTVGRISTCVHSSYYFIVTSTCLFPILPSKFLRTSGPPG